MHLDHFRFSVADGIALVEMDRAGETMNTIAPELMEDFAAIVDRLETDEGITAVVWTSAKPDFLAGADIRWFDQLDEASAGAAITDGHRLFDRLERIHLELGKPVVAAIRGACLGGGLEIALLASSRIASDAPTTTLGNPEVQLGVIPAGGGTQRLPAVVGVQAAFDLLLTGRSVDARKAARLGLVEEVVPDEQLVDTARAIAAGTRRPASSRGSLRDRARALLLERNPAGRRLLFSKARQRMLAETKGNYPAPPRVLDAVWTGLTEGRRAGLEAEARFFAELVVSAESRALRSIFFATQGLKRETWVPDDVSARPVRKVGIVGGGLMGGGLAAVSAWRAGSTVRVKEVDEAAVTRALRHVAGVIDERVARRRMRRFEAERVMNRVSGTTDWSGFGDAELIIEAVFEDISLKQQILSEAEAATGVDTVFASNTSSLPIMDLAEQATRPHNVLGMHYFSPVEKMPLLEVIATDRTGDEAVALAVAYGKRQGKTVIVVHDGPGFYTTRILGPYTAEAARMLEEGVSIDAIDEAMERWGFPVGPFRLMDEVGIDVGAKIARIMAGAFPERMPVPSMMDALTAEGRMGRKNRLGFYRYDRHGERGGVDGSVYRTIGTRPGARIDEVEIQQRMALAMVAEAARCLEEGVLRSARDGDVGAVMGLGFPPFRGGPFWWVDQVGAKEIVASLDELADRHGPRFAPPEVLRSHSVHGERFRP